VGCGTHVYPVAYGLPARKLVLFTVKIKEDTDLDLMGWPYVRQFLPRLSIDVRKSLTIDIIPFRFMAPQRVRIQHLT
jgi:hypothetical protein